jgi:RNA polymerase sigma factor (sigma-70 family)
MFSYTLTTLWAENVGRSPVAETTVYLQQCLDRIASGDESAREELLVAACDRLKRLTHKMFQSDGRLGRWEDDDDVFQNAVIRLGRRLRNVTPVSPREFFRLAAGEVRRELIDLARHYYGPQGLGANHASIAGTVPSKSPPPYEGQDASLDPVRLASWGEFHERASALPEEEREVFDLLWYQGLTQAEAAELLGVSTRTVMRRWREGCFRIADALGGSLPGM